MESLLQFVVEADFDLVSSIFYGLEDLLWKNPMKLSSSIVVGQLLTNKNDCNHYCGHILSPSSLEEAACEALTASVIKVFLSLCCFIIPSLRCFRCDARGRRVPMTAGPDSPPTSQPKNSLDYHQRNQGVIEMLSFEKNYAIFCATPSSVEKVGVFGAMVKQWILMKYNFNIQSENNTLAQKIDSALLSTYESLLQSGLDYKMNSFDILSMVKECIEDQMSVECLNVTTRPVLTNIPHHFQALIQADLWPLLVLSETLGVHRMFSALSYLMLQQLRHSSFPARAIADLSEDSALSKGELQLLNSLEERENDLQSSFCEDHDNINDNCSEILDHVHDISVECSRRTAPPAPHAYPVTALKDILHSMDISSMFDDDEDSNRGVIEPTSPKNAPISAFLEGGNKSIIKNPSKGTHLSVSETPQQRIQTINNGHGGLFENTFTTPIRALKSAKVINSKSSNNSPEESPIVATESPEEEARKRAIRRLREKARRDAAHRASSTTGLSKKEKLAIVQSQAAIARARSTSPAARANKLSNSRSDNGRLASPSVCSQNNSSVGRTFPNKQAVTPINLWGSPMYEAPKHAHHSPQTPTTVVDIDATIMRVFDISVPYPSLLLTFNHSQ